MQRQLVVGAVTDPLEREADRVADAVMSSLADVPTTRIRLAPRIDSAGRRAATATRIRRNGGGDLQERLGEVSKETSRRLEEVSKDTSRRLEQVSEDTAKRLSEQSDLVSLRLTLIEWSGTTTEQLAKRFGVDRFKQLLSIAGRENLLDIGTQALLLADPADPFALPKLAVDTRVAVAKAWGLTAAACAAGLVSMAARESTAPQTVLSAAASVGATLKQLVEAWLAGPAALATAKPWIAAATQTERDTIWQDKALMDTAQKKLSLDDYLALLPLVRVMAPTTDKTDTRWGSYDTQTLGPMVDSVIRKHLSGYVGGSVGRGSQVEGEMSIVGDEDWEKAFKRQWTKPYLQPFLTGANAFVDVNQPQRHIWIHKDRGGPGTAIHEGMHKYASPVLRDELINTYRGGGADVCNLDEGLTEYFTRLVIDTGGLGFARSSYPNQFTTVTRLKAKVGEDVLAKAYFDGDFDALKKEFLAKTKHDWADFARPLEANDYRTAQGLL